MNPKYGILVLILSVFIIGGCTSMQKTKISDESKEEKYFIIKGLNNAESGRMQEALNNFFDAEKINPKNPLTLKNIGLVYSKIGDPEQGKIYFQKSLEISKYDSEVLHNLAIIYYKEDNYQKSIELLNKIKIEDNNAKVILAKAYTYYQLSDFEKSYVEYKLLFSKEKFISFSTHKKYIDLLKKMNKNEEMYDMLNKIYNRNKDKSDYIILFADYFKDINLLEESFKILKEYVVNYEYDTKIMVKFAELYYLEGKYEEAEKYIKLVPDKDRLNKTVLEVRLKIFEAQGKENETESIKKILNNIKGNESDEGLEK